MPVATKIIPFPSRAKPRALPPKSRISEFAQLSEIIRDKRSGDAIKSLVPAASTTAGVIPSTQELNP
jgi:hypothetical protein